MTTTSTSLSQSRHVTLRSKSTTTIGSSRRDWLRSMAAWGLSGLSIGGTVSHVLSAKRAGDLDIGSRTQLFCDDFLIESKDGVRHSVRSKEFRER